jgi:hypothetical protein
VAIAGYSPVIDVSAGCCYSLFKTLVLCALFPSISVFFPAYCCNPNMLSNDSEWRAAELDDYQIANCSSFYFCNVVGLTAH